MQTLPAPCAPLPATRHDGWTPERQRRFLEHLAQTGSVARAAAHVGLSVSAAYALRRHPKAVAFREAWGLAVAECWTRVEETAIERVINGETEVIERGDDRIVRHRPCAPRLITHILDRAAAARARAEAAEAARAKTRESAQVAALREEILSISRNDPNFRRRRLPAYTDAATLAAQAFHTQAARLPDFATVDLDDPRGTPRRRKRPKPATS